MQWYYESGGSQQGPVSQEEIRKLVLTGGISRETLVWKEGMADWAPAGQTELAAYFPSTAQPPHTPPVPPSADTPRSYPLPSPSSMKSLWLWAVIITCVAQVLGIIDTLSLSRQVADFSNPSAFPGGGAYALNLLLGLGALVIYCILLYKLWSTIQDGQARTTPGKAVGFCFIPVFDLYWIFQAFWGLSIDMNAYAAQRGISAPRINEGMGLAVCILFLAALPSSVFVMWGMTWLAVALGVVLLVLEIIFWKQAVDAASAIVIAKS